MKKIFTVLSMVAITATATAQMNAFAGADFENWTDFTGSLNNFGLKEYATQGIGKGYNGSNSLHIEGTPGDNDYVFTAKAPEGVPNTITSITFLVKGTSAKSLSINLYRATKGYEVFNVADLASTDVVLEKAEVNSKTGNGTNGYTGTIDTGGKWVKVTLNMSGIDFNKATDKDFIALKVGKDKAYNLDIDNFQIISSDLAVVDINKSKTALVKNTSVSDNLFFAKTADVKIVNMAGQVVKEVKATEGSSVNLSSLAKGMYIVNGNVNGETVSQKIIKK